jgi:hypothetical protein
MIAAALAAVGMLTWRAVEVAGRTVWSLVRLITPQASAPEPGLCDELAEAAEEQRIFDEPSRSVEVAIRAFAMAHQAGSREYPSLRGLPENVQRWAAALTGDEAAAICATPARDRAISRHVNARTAADLIPGVRTLAGTMPQAAAANLQQAHEAIVDNFFSEYLPEPVRKAA